MTDFTEFQKKMRTLLPGLELRFDEPMAKHTSFRIGGPVEVMAFPKNPAELSEILKASALLDGKIAILGAGTNILAPDEGLDGLVICLKDCLDGVEQVSDTAISVMAGVTMTRAAVFAANLGLGGMEFAHGIPGTVGGGVYMNAGAYGGEMKQIVLETDFLESDGTPGTLRGEAHAFSYRKSAFIKTGRVILRSRLMLTPADPADIRRTMQELNARRREKQPLSFPSAGSFFKRPEGHFAGALIEEAGLKGLTVGGAQISEKHAGFLINLGGATSEDVCRLMKQVQKRVHEHSGVSLEPEVQFLGDFSQASVL